MSVVIGDKVSTETAYIVTSLDAAEAARARLLALVCAHLGDRVSSASRPRRFDGRGPLAYATGGRALASLRNLALATIRGGGLNIREARENFREDRAEAIAAITGRIL